MKLPENACTCDRCKAMCEMAPCHGTPEEMQALIDAGHADKLWVNDQFDTEMIYIKPLAAHSYSFFGADLRGRCPFLTKDSLCSLHDRGLKPLEGKVAVHSGAPDPTKGFKLRSGLAAAWRKPLGQFILKRFQNSECR